LIVDCNAEKDEKCFDLCDAGVAAVPKFSAGPMPPTGRTSSVAAPAAAATPSPSSQFTYYDSYGLGRVSESSHEYGPDYYIKVRRYDGEQEQQWTALESRGTYAHVDVDYWLTLVMFNLMPVINHIVPISAAFGNLDSASSFSDLPNLAE